MWRKKGKRKKEERNLAQFVDWVAHRRPLLRLRCNAQIHSGTSVTQHGRKCGGRKEEEKKRTDEEKKKKNKMWMRGSV